MYSSSMANKFLQLSSFKNSKRSWAIFDKLAEYGDEHSSYGYRDVQRPALHKEELRPSFQFNYNMYYNL